MKDFFKYAKNRMLYNILRWLLIGLGLIIIGIIKGVIK